MKGMSMGRSYGFGSGSSKYHGHSHSHYHMKIKRLKQKVMELEEANEELQGKLDKCNEKKEYLKKMIRRMKKKYFESMGTGGHSHYGHGHGKKSKMSFKELMGSDYHAWDADKMGTMASSESTESEEKSCSGSESCTHEESEDKSD